MTTPLNRSIVKAFQILELMRNNERALTLREVAMETDLTLATAHRFLSTLKAVGALRSAKGGGYEVGAMLSRFGPEASPGDPEAGTPRIADSELTRLAAPVVDDLARRLNATVHAATLDADDMVLFIAKRSPQGTPSVSTRVGARTEAYCTAIGKVLLAHLSPAHRAAYLGAGPFVALTARTITDPLRLRRELDDVRQRGYAIDLEEFTPGLRCAAVPIRNRHGRVVAALSVSVPAARLCRSQLPHLLESLQREALALECKLSRRAGHMRTRLPPEQAGAAAQGRGMAQARVRPG